MSGIYTNYAINIAEPKAEVQLIDRLICIPAGGWAPLTRVHAEHPDIVDAMRRGWIRLQASQPKTESDPQQEFIEIEAPSAVGSTTPKEAEKKAKKQAETRTMLSAADRLSADLKPDALKE